MGFRVLIILIAAFLFLFFPVYILQVAARFMLLLVLLSWLMSRLPRFFLSVKPELELIRGLHHERNVIKVSLTNPTIFPIAVLAVRDETGGLMVDGSAAQVFHIAPRSSAVLQYEVWSNTRGMYRLGPIHVAGADPLGLFPWEIDVATKRLAFIYPRLAPVSFQSRHGLPGGPKRSHHPMFLDQTQLRSIRPYETGDDPRHIHWKASAKSGDLMTTEFARTLTVPFYVVLNLDESDYHFKRRSGHIERCIEAATAFIDQAALESYSVGFATNGTIPIDARDALDLEENEDGIFHLPVSPALANASHLLSVLSVIGAKPARKDPAQTDQRKNSARKIQNEHLVDNGSSERQRTSLISVFETLAFQLSPRILVITPPILPEDFDHIVTLVPRTCRIDFWFLDEHQDRNNRIDHRGAPPFFSVRLRKLPEYGDDLMQQEYDRA